jgi:predicted nucleic acid-binding protein
LSAGLILDVSATLPWCFEDEETAGSIALLDHLADTAAVVPALWHIELANALLQAERRDRIDTPAIVKFMALLDSLTIETDFAFDHRQLPPLLALARRHRLTAYDAAYLELAMRHRMPIATRDKALRRAALSVGIALSDA